MTWMHWVLIAMPVVQAALLIVALRIHDHFNPPTHAPAPELTEKPEGE